MVPCPDPQAGEHPATVAARTEGEKTGGGSGTKNRGRHGFCLLGLSGSRNWAEGERGERRGRGTSAVRVVGARLSGDSQLYRRMGGQEKKSLDANTLFCNPSHQGLSGCAHE